VPVELGFSVKFVLKTSTIILSVGFIYSIYNLYLRHQLYGARLILEFDDFAGFNGFTTT